MNRTRDDDDDPLPISRAEKARLHRMRVAAVERRQRQQQLPEDNARTTANKIEARYIKSPDVVGLLRSIERNRKALLDALKTLQSWLNKSSEFAESWRDFTSSGGISADDFGHFIDGRFCARRTRQKRHLRLIAGSDPSGRKLRAKGG
jgi:hypothetical protein